MSLLRATWDCFNLDAMMEIVRLLRKDCVYVRIREGKCLIYVY